jgi:Fe-S cluster biogenesis protein NfuA
METQQTEKKVPTTVYAESTPNPYTMKFVANRLLIKGNPLEFDDPNDVSNSPLAAKLFSFPFIKTVFFAGNYVSLTRTEQIDWQDVVLELREFIRDYLNSDQAVILEEDFQIYPQADKPKLKDAEPETEEDKKIIEILEEYIKPAVQQDGGNIFFKSFNPEDGVVQVILQGACSGCPSSTVTLKQGIEGLLKRMMPGKVESVEAFNG